MYETIKNMLHSNAYSIASDISTFKKWESEKITTEQCIDRFRFNNYQPHRVEINPKEFELWLNSLGYIRGK